MATGPAGITANIDQTQPVVYTQDKFSSIACTVLDNGTPVTTGTEVTGQIFNDSSPISLGTAKALAGGRVAFAAFNDDESLFSENNGTVELSVTVKNVESPKVQLQYYLLDVPIIRIEPNPVSEAGDFAAVQMTLNDKLSPTTLAAGIPFQITSTPAMLAKFFPGQVPFSGKTQKDQLTYPLKVGPFDYGDIEQKTDIALTLLLGGDKSGQGAVQLKNWTIGAATPVPAPYIDAPGKPTVITTGLLGGKDGGILPIFMPPYRGATKNAAAFLMAYQYPQQTNYDAIIIGRYDLSATDGNTGHEFEIKVDSTGPFTTNGSWSIYYVIKEFGDQNPMAISKHLIVDVKLPFLSKGLAHFPTPAVPRNYDQVNYANQDPLKSIIYIPKNFPLKANDEIFASFQLVGDSYANNNSTFNIPVPPMILTAPTTQFTTFLIPSSKIGLHYPCDASLFFTIKRDGVAVATTGIARLSVSTRQDQ